MKTEPDISCSTCYWWKHPSRGRWCAKHRSVVIGTKKYRGTPPTYACGEWTKLPVARCRDCLYWEAARRPRAAAPCSQLNLPDPAEGGVRGRTPESVPCRHWLQVSRMQYRMNQYVAINGVLPEVYQIEPRGQPWSIILLSDQDSGLALHWQPEGPGAGHWTLAPVEILNPIDVESMTVRQWTPDGETSHGAAFSGSMYVRSDTGETSTWSEQRMNHEMLRSGPSRGACFVAIHPEPRRVRPVGREEVQAGVREAIEQQVSSVQDEPWGPYWTDLKEQVQACLDSGLARGLALLSVSRQFNREHTELRLTPEDVKRLQRQLGVIFAPRRNDESEEDTAE